MMEICPCCGFTADKKNVTDIGNSLRLSRLERSVFNFFARRFGQNLDPSWILEAAYADDPDGGPEHANIVVAMTIQRLRNKIAPHGLTIEGTKGRHGGRRMVWKDGAR
ncbi:hypothetical protein GOC60_14860 [Sinorhizobium meliloti]|nr:hypothetical protein [Sinorhizobium meliloti]